MKRSVWSLSALLILAACAQRPEPDTSAADAAAIRAWVDQFVVAWNAADNATLGPMIAEDAVLMPPDGPPRQGREAILATMGEGYDPTMAQQSATTDEVIVIGDYAYARGTWNLDPRPAATIDLPATNGKWSTLFKRGADGSWQVSRWIWNQPSEVVPAGG